MRCHEARSGCCAPSSAESSPFPLRRTLDYHPVSLTVTVTEHFPGLLPRCDTAEVCTEESSSLRGTRQFNAHTVSPSDRELHGAQFRQCHSRRHTGANFPAKCCDGPGPSPMTPRRPGADRASLPRPAKRDRPRPKGPLPAFGRRHHPLICFIVAETDQQNASFVKNFIAHHLALPPMEHSGHPRPPLTTRPLETVLPECKDAPSWLAHSRCMRLLRLRRRHKAQR